MKAQSIECKLAQAQVTRHLAGQPVSNEAIRQLEEHIAECPSCKESVEERRAALKASIRARAAAYMPDEAPANPAQAPAAFQPYNPATLKALAEMRTETQSPLAPKNLLAVLGGRSWKPVAYGACLAAALIAMSWIARDPTRLFGSRASVLPTVAPPVSKPRVPPPAAQQLDSLLPTPTYDQSDPVPLASTMDGAAARYALSKARERLAATAVKDRSVAKPPAQTPIKVPVKPAVRPPRRTKTKQRAAASSSVRVYDASGKPISR